MLHFFDILPDINLNIMSHDQTLTSLQSSLMGKLEGIFKTQTIHATIVQGDTMSAFCGSLSSFYHKVPIFHVEAGLRTYNIYEPFPEEALRSMISKIATLHFAPTSKNIISLKNEGITKNIFKTGNTSIDALNFVSKKKLAPQNTIIKELIEQKKQTVLITIHRRENHDKNRMKNILKAIIQLSRLFDDFNFIIPVHPNPNVKSEITNTLQGYHNIILTEALEYHELVMMLHYSTLILTDSGGIQEEAPTFGTPLLILRNTTERQEVVDEGFAKLVGTNVSKIIQEAKKILLNPHKVKKANPYGNGTASLTIIKIIRSFFEQNKQ